MLCRTINSSQCIKHSFTIHHSECVTYNLAKNNPPGHKTELLAVQKLNEVYCSYSWRTADRKLCAEHPRKMPLFGWGAQGSLQKKSEGHHLADPYFRLFFSFLLENSKIVGQNSKWTKWRGSLPFFCCNLGYPVLVIETE